MAAFDRTKIFINSVQTGLLSAQINTSWFVLWVNCYMADVCNRYKTQMLRRKKNVYAKKGNKIFSQKNILLHNILTPWKLRRLLCKDKCCTFWPAFGCSTPPKLVKISFFAFHARFCIKNNENEAIYIICMPYYPPKKFSFKSCKTCENCKNADFDQSLK